MTRQSAGQSFSFRVTTWRIGTALLVAFVGACNGAEAFEQAAETRQLATTLQVEFSKAVEASNRAMPTKSGSASSESAREADAARARVKSAERKLEGLLTQLQYADERKLLEEFHGKFAAYEVLDADTNARSVALTLGQKRTLVATCDDSLHALHEALVARARRPTR